MPKAKTNLRKPGWADNIVPETFNGLNINSTGSEPSIRNAPPPTGSQYSSKQKIRRETLAKVENDMTRNLFKVVSQALSNQIRLPFSISDFEAERSRGINIHHAPAFQDLANHPKRLSIDEGPAVVTDITGTPILWYFPRFIGTGLQANLMKSIGDLASVYQPPPDAKAHDRRACVNQSAAGMPDAPGVRYMTRGQSTRAENLTSQQLELDRPRPEATTEFSPCTLEEPIVITEAQPAPETYKEVDGEVHLEGMHQACPIDSSKNQTSATEDVQATLAEYKPFAYYFSPGWCQTGMQYVRPIQMSVHLRNALSEGSNETIAFLEAKRLLDKQIALLTEIIHPDLSSSMRQLKAHMSSVKGATGTTIVNGWTSDFPCYGVAINRVTGMHRDIKGIRAGLDVIGVCGTFTEGGDLELADLNLRLEWTPGCLAAFDGYDFRHKVHEWSGGSRIALISFCRQSTWSALGLDCILTRPTLKDCQNQLAIVMERRAVDQTKRVSTRKLPSGNEARKQANQGAV
ncbi:hypothetical protein FRC11_000301 [Ceratobasidium sp. 423]|nr:hypothetical protein FRC11_000301 [Ceratobasidium sp. 423]